MVQRPKPAGEPPGGADEGKTLTLALQPIYQEILAAEIDSALIKARSLVSGLPEPEELWRLHSILDLLEPLHTAAMMTVIMGDVGSIQAYVAALATIYQDFKKRASILEARYAPEPDS